MTEVLKMITDKWLVSKNVNQRDKIQKCNKWNFRVESVSSGSDSKKECKSWK